MKTPTPESPAEQEIRELLEELKSRNTQPNRDYFIFGEIVKLKDGDRKYGQTE